MKLTQLEKDAYLIIYKDRIERLEKELKELKEKIKELEKENDRYNKTTRS